MGKRTDVTSYEYRKLRASVLQESDVCILCGHSAADAVDHIIPVSRGGDALDRANMAPIHGVKGCPSCSRKCNSTKSNKLMAELDLVKTTRDWYSAPN